MRTTDARGRWVLVATVAASAMALLDATAVNLALPRIGEELGATFGDLQWIVNGYTLALASLILLGGSLGDRLGRRRVFLVGAAWFTLASVACALAPTPILLIAARVLQGVGAALLTPGSLSILQASFEPSDRPKAIGIWSGFTGVGAAIGPFLGGWLVEAASWRWIFLINIPLGAVVLWVGRAHIPETKDPEAASELDFPGTLLGIAALALLTLGLTDQQWIVTGGGFAALVAFILVERARSNALVPMEIFASRTFSGTNAVTLLLYGALGVVFFLLGLVLQGPLGYTPLQAGIATVPITILMLALSARAGVLGARIGPRIPMTVGPLLVAGALLLMTRISPDSGYFTGVFPAVVLFGLGLVLTVAPLTATALGSVADRHAGVASGVNNAIARTGQLLAVAAIPAIAGFAADQEVGDEQLLSGFDRVLWAAAAAIIVGAVIAWLTVGQKTEPVDHEAPDHREQGHECYHCGVSGPPPRLPSEAR